MQKPKQNKNTGAKFWHKKKRDNQQNSRSGAKQNFTNAPIINLAHCPHINGIATQMPI